MLRQCLTLAQAAVVHITQTRLVLHLGARVLHQIAVVTALHDGPILYQRTVVLYLWPCHLVLRPVCRDIRARLRRYRAGHIAC